MLKLKQMTMLMAGISAAVLAGCGPEVAQNRDLTLQLQETTNQHPVRVSVAVDGVEVFGPAGTINPGETKRITLNDPAGDTQLIGQHTILYTFDRIGVIGTVGHAELTVLSDNAVVFEDDSRKVLTGFALTYSFSYTITEPDD